jgi:hypothetical protein
MRWVIVVMLVLLVIVALSLVPQDRPADSLQEAVGDDAVAATWVYDDVDAGLARARETGKPLLVAFR